MQMAGPRLSGLDACIEDAKRAYQEIDDPDAPTLRPLADGLDARIDAFRSARSRLPRAYQRRVVRPLLAALRERPAEAREYAEYFDEISEALLPHEGDLVQATAAFQEVVADVYAGFLDEAEREDTRLPDHHVLPPLVKWHPLDVEEGPYAIGHDEDWNVRAGIVSLPVSHATCGLTGWTLLAHETAGHDILGATDKLVEELSKKVRAALGRTTPLGKHWSGRLEEAASDVIGVLNMGPAAAVGLIACFRGINGAWYERATLDSSEEEWDHHPLQILRGFLVAETVRLLQFDGAEAWAKALVSEVETDLPDTAIRLAEGDIDHQKALDSAGVVARTIALRELESLDDHALAEIQNWRNGDEDEVMRLRRYFRRGQPMPTRFSEGSYAAHAVAAAVLEALDGRNVENALQTLRRMLRRMHAANPDWAR
jgi:hypothetical protein